MRDFGLTTGSGGGGRGFHEVVFGIRKNNFSITLQVVCNAASVPFPGTIGGAGVCCFAVGNGIYESFTVEHLAGLTNLYCVTAAFDTSLLQHGLDLGPPLRRHVLKTLRHIGSFLAIGVAVALNLPEPRFNRGYLCMCGAGGEREAARRKYREAVRSDLEQSKFPQFQTK